MRFTAIIPLTKIIHTLQKNVAFKTLFNSSRDTLTRKRPIGKLLGDAIVSSIQTLLMIGGFIILFSVLNKMITVFHITAASFFYYATYFIILPTKYRF